MELRLLSAHLCRAELHVKAPHVTLEWKSCCFRWLYCCPTQQMLHMCAMWCIIYQRQSLLDLFGCVLDCGTGVVRGLWTQQVSHSTILQPSVSVSPGAVPVRHFACAKPW